MEDKPKPINNATLDPEEFAKTMVETRLKRIEDCKKILEANGYKVTKIK